MLQIDTPCQTFLATPLAKGQHSKEIRWWHLKIRVLVLKYNRITAKTLTSSQLSVCDMLTHVNFPTFTMVEHRS